MSANGASEPVASSTASSFALNPSLLRCDCMGPKGLTCSQTRDKPYVLRARRSPRWAEPVSVGLRKPHASSLWPLYPRLRGLPPSPCDYLEKPPMSDENRSTSVPLEDVQARRPMAHVSLSRVGVTGVEKVVRIHSNGDEQLFYAELECFVDLGPRQKGAHMSRFEETVNEVIDEVVLGEAFKAETLAAHIAERVRERQDAARAKASIRARYPEHKPAPVSGARTQ